MVVDTASAVRHQTLNHFIHTFIRNYDRESAAERTMRSRYVPKNIKVQLLAAVRGCEGNERDASTRISSIADMGLFIDTSCSEIAYYHSITSSVLQWTLSLYVTETHVRNVVKTVLQDMGRITDEDIQFMLEKYRYNEEQKMAGNLLCESGVDRILSFMKPKKFQPSVTYFSYYSQSLMLKLARSVLKNSVMFLNSDVFDVGPDPTANTDDAENTELYNDYKQHTRKLATLAETESLERMERVLNKRTRNSEGVEMREPPQEITTAYDRPLSSDSEEHAESDEEVSGSVRNSPYNREDLEVENILKRLSADGVDRNYGRVRISDISDGDINGSAAAQTLQERRSATSDRDRPPCGGDGTREATETALVLSGTAEDYMASFLRGADEFNDASYEYESNEALLVQRKNHASFGAVTTEADRIHMTYRYVPTTPRSLRHVSRQRQRSTTLVEHGSVTRLQTTLLDIGSADEVPDALRGPRSRQLPMPPDMHDVVAKSLRSFRPHAIEHNLTFRPRGRTPGETFQD